ncbi:uncharacterized protein LOC143223726 [Tachypleus tridentatus]|uniref:uncharacterized protein LOC143223726 n=1 Tax=Tachypleus tridentatus TaxID=6853 RepID=UPI003FD1B84E
MKVTTFKYSSTHEFLKNSPSKEIQRVWYEVQNNLLSYDTSQSKMMSEIRQGKIALLGSRSWLESASQEFSGQKPTCDYHVAEENIKSDYWALGLQKHSRFLDIFSQITQRLFQTGVMYYWFQRELEFSNAGSCHFVHSEAIEVELQKGTLGDIQMAFYVLIAGLVISFFVFTLEVLLHKWNWSLNH